MWTLMLMYLAGLVFSVAVGGWSTGGLQRLLLPLVRRWCFVWESLAVTIRFIWRRNDERGGDRAAVWAAMYFAEQIESAARLREHIEYLQAFYDWVQKPEESK